MQLTSNSRGDFDSLYLLMLGVFDDLQPTSYMLPRQAVWLQFYNAIVFTKKGVVIYSETQYWASS